MTELALHTGPCAFFPQAERGTFACLTATAPTTPEEINVSEIVGTLRIGIIDFSPVHPVPQEFLNRSITCLPADIYRHFQAIGAPEINATTYIFATYLDLWMLAQKHNFPQTLPNGYQLPTEYKAPGEETATKIQSYKDVWERIYESHLARLPHEPRPADKQPGNKDACIVRKYITQL